jgi:putative spermidine/putrescine transport system permease protein
VKTAASADVSSRIDGRPAPVGRSRGHRLSTYLYRRPKLVLALLLGFPLLWLVAVYLGSLSMLVLQSFFGSDSLTGQVVRVFTLANLCRAFPRGEHRSSSGRS